MTQAAASYIGYVIQYAIAMLQATAQFQVLQPVNPNNAVIRSMGGYNTQGGLPTQAMSLGGVSINLQAGTTFCAVVHGEEFPVTEVALYTYAHNGKVMIELYLPIAQITTGASDQIEYVRTQASLIAEQINALFGQAIGYLSRGTCMVKSHNLYPPVSDLAALGRADLQLDWHSP
jgi:hypothetical protein